MRLSEGEVDVLKKSVKELDNKAKLYLFGSRADINKRGGDIDLLIISNKIKRKNTRKIRLDFFQEFGEQKLDIVVDNGSLKEPFVKYIFEKAVLL
jgi:predicted nucleotidyltransferase